MAGDRHENNKHTSRHENYPRKTNQDQWECPHCHRKVHDPNHLPDDGSVDAWMGICLQHEPGCEWIDDYAPPAVKKRLAQGAAA